MLHRALPLIGAGQKVGLLGGSFDPAHDGHVHVTRQALKRFDLDQVWWLVSPGNPLKPNAPAGLSVRMRRARMLAKDRRIFVSDFETRLGTAYTAQTLSALVAMRPRARFVWLMGEDNLAQFHRWRDWQDIAEMVPIGVVSRPRAGIPALSAPFARRFRSRRLPESAAPLLADRPAPVWCMLNGPLNDASSSQIRAGNRGD